MTARIVALAALVIILIPAFGAAESAANPRGYETDIMAETFGYSQADVDVPLAEIFQGCPRRDCITSVDAPHFLRASEVRHLKASDLLLIVEYGATKKAYPTRYLDRHEIVNDEFDGVPLVVTYCPLCGSGLAFRRTVDGDVTEFGVSGLLHNNDLIMYDRATNSLWQQITGEAFAGPRRGMELKTVPSTMAFWSRWQDLNPEARVLAPPRNDVDYGTEPYLDYASSDRLLFPVRLQDARLKPKRLVIGVEVSGQAIAIDAQWLAHRESGWQREVDGQQLVVLTQEDGGVIASYGGQPVAAHRMYWFAWYSFHPGTALIGGDD